MTWARLELSRSGRVERKERIFDLWLNCHTQDEIAAKLDISQAVVNSKLKLLLENTKMVFSDKSLDFEQDKDFTPPIYNVWAVS